MADAPNPNAPPAETSSPGRRRPRTLRSLLLVVLPILAAAAGLYWYATTGRYVVTDNAYVKADLVAISTDVDGRVIAVEVEENQRVRQGEVLFRLDPEPFRIELDRAEAELVATRHEIAGWRAEFRQVQAELAEAGERAAYHAHQAGRQRALQQRGIAAETRLEQAELELMAARQHEAALREKVRTVLAKLGGDPEAAVEQHPAHRAAAAARARAALDLARTVVKAPIDGIVSRLRLEPGEWLEEGAPAFTIVDSAASWIEANLKETQLTHVEVGQPVEVEIDAFPDDRWQGRVASLSAATGAEFALIPPQNASGNWVKVVQRLPVRIELDPVAGQPPLRAGMTATVAIDTGREPALAQLINNAIASVRGKP